MKLTTIFSFFLLLFLASGCEDDLMMPDLDSAAMPSELSLDFQITGDNTGTVTVRPGGQAVTAFSVDFGDGGAMGTSMAPGETVTHVYDEGVYTVTLEAMNINGETTTYTEELTVSFRAPENLDVTVTPTAGNPLSIDVTATADLETNFLAYFGEDPDEEPVSFQEGETVSYEYGTTGEYELVVEARSGGAATVSDTITVTINNPIFLPLTFEDASKQYNFLGFGGATAEVVDNPDAGGMNTSARVARLNKQQDSEVWAGV
ncbi:MAG: PKD domain-containing protein, partial [Lewinella sp.]